MILFRIIFFFTIVGLLAIPVHTYAGVMEPSMPGPVVPETIVHLDQATPDWLSSWKKARTDARLGNLRRAAQKYQEIINGKPNVIQTRWELARIRVAQGKYDLAADLLENLLPEYQNNVEILTLMAHVQEKLGHSERAVRFYQKALGVRGDNIHALSGMTRLLLAEGKLRNCLIYLEKLYNLTSRNREVAKKLAGIYYDLGFYQETLSILEPVVNSNSASSEELLLVARCKTHLNDRESAFTYWKKLVRQDWNNREAHKWLAEYYQKEKNWQDAHTHLVVLKELHPEDNSLFFKIARCLAGLNDFEKALESVNRYLAHHPHDREALRLLVNINASLDREEETLSALDRYFAVESKPPPEKLKQAARLYDARGRYKEAIPLYKKLIKNNPDDSHLLKTLADDLLAIGEDEGALNILSQLTAISPDREIYRAMADLLKKLSRRDELILVLERLHIIEPKNPEILLKLISLYLQQHEKKRAEVLYRKIADQLLASSSLLKERGRLASILGMTEHALRDYSHFLEMEYDREVCFNCIQLSGNLGLVARLNHFTVLFLRESAGAGSVNKHNLKKELLKEKYFREIGAKDYLVIAKAWREAFLDETSRQMYKFVIDKPGAARDIRSQAFLGLAELYRQEGRIYKTEEAYRMAMSLSDERFCIMGLLVETFIENGNYERAESWLTLMDYVDKKEASEDLLCQLSDHDLPSSKTVKWYSSFLTLKMEISKGSFHEAAYRGERLIQKIFQEEGWADLSDYQDSDEYRIIYRLKELITLCSIQLGDFEQAERLIAELENGKELSLLPESLKIMMIRKKIGYFNGLIESLLSKTSYDLGLLSSLNKDLSCLEKDGFNMDRQGFIELIRQAVLQKNPDNLRAAILLCQASIDKGNYEDALYSCRKLLERFPESVYLHSLAASLYYRLHMDDQTLYHCDQVLAGNGERAGILLLKARTIWRSDRKVALTIIESYLEEGAEKLVKDSAARQNISLPPRPEISFLEKWRNRIIRQEESRKKYLDRIMEPEFFIGSVRGDFFQVVYRYYARYKWQHIFREEASARRAVLRGKYFRAAHHFANLLSIQDQTDVSLIFDLARVYGKLGRFEDEAFLYGQIKKIDPDFPGLDERVKRNKLQLKPRLALKYGYQKEEGWDGYKAMEKLEGGGSYRYLFTPREQLEIFASQIRYDPTGEVGESLSAKRFFLASKGRFLLDSSFKFGVGIEFLNYDNKRTGLFSGKIARKFADDVVVDLSFEREVVTDTYASLIRNVVAESSKASISWDISPFFSAGAYYGLTSYSDANELDEYSLWTKCHIFGKPSYLTFSYQYSFKNADESEVEMGILLADGFRSDDHPYWAPQDYWVNSFALNWKQPIPLLLTNYETPSYYSASYIFDYDESGQVRQTLNGGIYLELGHHLIGRSSFRYTASENYDVRRFSLAVIYRW